MPGEKNRYAGLHRRCDSLFPDDTHSLFITQVIAQAKLGQEDVFFCADIGIRGGVDQIGLIIQLGGVLFVVETETTGQFPAILKTPVCFTEECFVFNINIALYIDQCGCSVKELIIGFAGVLGKIDAQETVQCVCVITQT
nr:hypothetical protein [Aliamphritea spongicola]